MRIEPVLTPHTVDDYEIIFMNNVPLMVTIDRDAGDSIEWDHPNVTIFHKAARPSLADPDTAIPGEDITIFMDHVTFITHRTRTVIPMSPESHDEFAKTIHRLSSTIQ